MSGWRVALAFLIAIPAVAAAKEREPEVLNRTSKWVVEYDRDACHLYAEFGVGEAMVVARFTRYKPGDWFDLAVYGKRLRSDKTRADAKIDFGLKDVPIERTATNGSAGKLPAVFFNAVRVDGWRSRTGGETPPKVTPEQEAAVTGVTVAIRRKAPFRLQLDSMGKPFAQMRHCSDDLLQSWGYDPAVQSTLLRPPTPLESPVTWLSPNDYPVGAVAMGHNGIVQFRLDVDPQGKVAGCYVLARTSPDDFADSTCRIVTKRAKLQPALDAQGKPVRSYFVYKVNWQIEA